MMQAAWDSAEPGVLFWDNIINGSPADCYADVGIEPALPTRAASFPCARTTAVGSSS
jgi:ribonucleoside-diphosphate reductase alpha chain